MRFRIVHILSLTVDITIEIFVVTSTINEQHSSNGIGFIAIRFYMVLVPVLLLPLPVAVRLCASVWNTVQRDHTKKEKSKNELSLCVAHFFLV